MRALQYRFWWYAALAAEPFGWDSRVHLYAWERVLKYADFGECCDCGEGDPF